jgi:hypothetical protein
MPACFNAGHWWVNSGPNKQRCRRHTADGTFELVKLTLA